VDQIPEDVSKKVEKYTEKIRRRLVEENSALATRLGDKDADQYVVGMEILRRFLYTISGKNTSIITFEADSFRDHTCLYRITPPYDRSVHQIIFLRYINGFYQPVVFHVNNKWQHVLPVDARLKAPFDELFRGFGDAALPPPLPTPTTTTPPEPPQDGLLERCIPSAYRIQALTGNKDCFHTIEMIRHQYVGDVDQMPEKVESHAEQSRRQNKNDDVATKRLDDSKILRKFLQRQRAADKRMTSVVIYDPPDSTGTFHYDIIVPRSHSSQDTIFLRYVNHCYQPVVFKVNNKWQHRIPVEMKLQAPFDRFFEVFSNPAIFEVAPNLPIAPPSTRSDPFLEALVPRSTYRIQSVPGDGNCFYYAISLVLLEIDDLNGISRPVPQNITDMMVRLRRSTAHYIYTHYLEEMYIRDVHNELPAKHTGKNAFVEYFVTKSPYADDVEVRIIQEAIAHKNVAVVIYTPSSIQQFYSYDAVVPENIESIIVLKLDHEHYEPILFYVHGKWQHNIPIGMKNSATYGKLFESIADVWGEFGQKIFPDRRIMQQEMDTHVIAPVSPWWRRSTSSMDG